MRKVMPDYSPRLTLDRGGLKRQSNPVGDRDMVKVGIVVWILPLLWMAESCQEPWKIETDDPQVTTIIAFSNVTNSGEFEYLRWTWYSSQGGRWSVTIWKSLKDGAARGGFVYKLNNKTGSNLVVYGWSNEGGELHGSKIIKSIDNESEWIITLCDGTKFEFSPEDELWVAKYNNERILEEQIEGQLPSRSLFIQKFRALDNRVRRQVTRQEYPTMIPSDSQRDNSPTWIDRVYDFFFGVGDQVSGRKDGIFVRFARWLKGMACRIGGRCSPGDGDAGDVPEGRPPVAPPPPSPPDAEVLPASTETGNNV